MKSLKKLLAAAAVCVMALAVFTACGMSKDEHSDALMKVIRDAFKSTYPSVTIEHDTSLDARAQSILDDLKKPEIADSVSAVIVKRETTDEDDTAGLKKEAKAIADAFTAKMEKAAAAATLTTVSDGDNTDSQTGTTTQESATVSGTIKLGFGYGKIDGTHYIVCAYELPTA